MRHKTWQVALRQLQCAGADLSLLTFSM